MEPGNVLISGAGIAGPALAHWLGRLGVRTTVVERATALREGGQAVDFRGEAHIGVLTKMGLLERVKAKRTRPLDIALLDKEGRAVGRLPASFAGGEVEIARGDLARLLYEATRETTEYRFGDAVASLREDAGGVEVAFERGGGGRFDAVVGADGMHSRVRALALADEAACVKHLGCYVALYALPDALGLRDSSVLYGAPGRGVLVTPSDDGASATALFVFRSPARDELRRDPAAQHDAVERAFEGVGWRVPALLEAARAGRAVYFDAIACVEMDRYSSGRVALLGDAAWGGTLGGQGTGAAIVGAYVLAGELAASGGDLAAAFARYERRMRPYATRCQTGARHAGGFFAPTSSAGLALRNAFYALMGSRPMARMLERMTTSAARDIELEDYAALAA